MQPGATIRILPIHVANKIAAGEVVDRPASVAKELIENSLDAAASQVDVEVTAGGRKLVAVRDNGTGMNRDDAVLSVERYATSKIRDVDDIERIATLGFRGEALAAITAVSRFRLTTCLKGEVSGTEVLVAAGRIQDVRDLGVPAGASIEVRDLFFNVPARRKFLRSAQTEIAHLRTGFIVQALARPDVGMSLTVDGRESYRLVAGTLDDRLRDLFGSDARRDLRPVEWRSDEIAVAGYVSLPALSRADRSEQYVFINRRATSAALVGFAVREAYRTLLPEGRHPMLFLFIETNPELVDVNVHPTKREVRFRHPADVRDAVVAAVRQALSGGGVPGALRPPGPAEAAPPRASAGAELRIDDLPAARAFKYPRLPVPEFDAFRGAPPPPVPASPLVPESSSPSAPHPAPGAPPSALPSAPWSWCRVLGQIGSLYVVLEIDDGYVLMDPHAAHERVLFERFMAGVIGGQVPTQSLLLPESVDLLPHDALLVRRNLDLFRQLGFGISQFGGDAFVVDTVPGCFSGVGARALLIEIAGALEEAGARGATERWREEAIARAACRAAVKARDRLSLEEIEKLVVDLAGATMPYTCPHGRPTLIFTSFKDLNRKFGRG